MNTRIEVRDYFAAHAPDKPGWFEKTYTTKQELREGLRDGKKYYQPHTVREYEDTIDWETRWRYHYADAMMKARKL